MSKRINHLENELDLLEEVVSKFIFIFSQTATPDQLEQLNNLHQWFEQECERRFK